MEAQGYRRSLVLPPQATKFTIAISSSRRRERRNLIYIWTRSGALFCVPFLCFLSWPNPDEGYGHKNLSALKQALAECEL